MDFPPLTKELADQLMKLEGEARGVTFKTDAQFVLEEKSQEGLIQVQEKLKAIGHPIDYERIESMSFYPLGLRIISLLAIQNVFHFSEEDIKHLGSHGPKRSLIIKLFMKYFLSMDETGKRSPEMWSKNFTVGTMSDEPHEKERQNIVRVKDFSPHPIFCPYLNGYITSIVQMITGAKITTKETKCTFRGDPYHEYLSTW